MMYFHFAMTRSKLPPIDSQAFVELGRHLEHNLRFQVGRDGRKILGGGPEIVFLAKLDRVVRLALETDFAPFRVSGTMRSMPVTVQDAFGRNQRVLRPRYVKTATANSFYPATEELAGILSWRALRSGLTIFQQSDPFADQLLHAPHIRLLLDTFVRHPVSECLGGNIESPVGSGGRILAEEYNDFAAQLRRAMRDSKSLRHDWHNWNLGSRENAANLPVYLDNLFAKHGEVTVLHLRLFHARERANLVTSPVDEQLRDLQMLRTCRAKLFDRMRRKHALFTDDPGYVWAILPSLEGGYALHLTLLFSTAALRKVLDDKRVEAEHTGTVLRRHVDQIGMYWVDVATLGLGSYMSGDTTAALYGHDWVHGEVGADERSKRGKLKETLGYLAMRRALVRLKNEPPGQYFGLPERKARSPRRLTAGGEQTSLG
ncbi:hypothetical protein ACS0ZG_09545 [Burkholderia gladioli]|uniref:hypothetical protein n=1 Tax=Burkholderia gladioli TaxID=28095 RepID=UPI003F791688